MATLKIFKPKSESAGAIFADERHFQARPMGVRPGIGRQFTINHTTLRPMSDKLFLHQGRFKAGHAALLAHKTAENR